MKLLINSLLFTLIVIYLFVENAVLLFTLFYTFLIFIIINKYVIKANEYKFINLSVFLFYLLLSIILFELQKTILPDWLGFTGPYGSIGTDDSRFYAAISANWKELPKMAQDWRLLIAPHSYTKFLKILYPFKVIHPLQLIIPNIIGISFIPYFTYKLSELLTNDKQVSKIAFFLVLFCPLILTSGLILLRDGWTTFLFIAGFYYVLKNNYKAFFIVLSVLLFVRIASGAMLIVTVIMYLFYKKMKRPIITRNQLVVFIIISIISIAIFIFSFDFLMKYIESKGVSITGRTDFIQGDSQFKGTTIEKIYSLPLMLRLIVGTIFFFFQPFLHFTFITEGVFNVRRFFMLTITPLLFIFYFRYLFRGVIFALEKSNKKIIFLFLFLLLLMVMISQFSVQWRHKVMVMPLFYILIAYGVNRKSLNSNILSVIMAILIFLIQLIFLLK